MDCRGCGEVFQHEGFAVLADGSHVVTGIPDDVIATLPQWCEDCYWGKPDD